MNIFFTAYGRFQAQNVKIKKYLVKLSDSMDYNRNI